MAIATCERPAEALPQLTPGQTETPRVHLIGIGGAGMTALAEILADRGWHISGSDQERASPLSLLRRRGINVYHGHASDHVPLDASLVVYSGAVPEENCERQAAAQGGLIQLSYAQMLGRLMQGHDGICVAGTHGKSTTSAMVAVTLEAAGLDPTVAVGARLRDWNGSGRAGNSHWFVAEACEYERNFLHLCPTAAAILGIEPDHFDYYRNSRDLVSAFREFAGLVPRIGMVVARADCPVTAEVVRSLPAPVQTFSLERGADWWATDLRRHQGRYRFRIFYRGRFMTEVALAIPGRHNALNALAATALAYWAGVPTVTIRESLEEFSGLCRRFEILGSWRGVTLVDDYAHHPTEVRACLATAREVFGQRRLWCVFQPHQFSRTVALWEEFARSFDLADRVIISDIYTARESPDGAAQVVADLGQAIARRGVTVIPTRPPTQTEALLREQLQPGDVLITVGAGDIGRLAYALCEGLCRHRDAG